MFAHRIDFVNGRAAFEQRIGGLLFVFERQPSRRTWKKRGTSTRRQKQEQILPAAAAREIHDPARSMQTGAIGNRMSGFDDLDLFQRQLVAVFHHDHAAGDFLAENL